MEARVIAASVFIKGPTMPAPYEEMGYQLKLYVGAAGAPAATQIEGATDVDYNLAPTKAPTTDRGTGGNVPTEYENVVGNKPTVTWKQHNNSNDTTLATLIAAAIAGLPVAVKIVTLAGATLVDGDFTLQKDLTGPLAGEQLYTFTGTATKQAGRRCTLG